jgi:hypothetical protein
LGSGVSQQKATVLAGEFERSFQRILDARENRCHHRTTGLMLSQMQELVRQVHNALTEPWNKGVVARNRVGCMPNWSACPTVPPSASPTAAGMHPRCERHFATTPVAEIVAHSGGGIVDKGAEASAMAKRLIVCCDGTWNTPN